MIKLAKLSVLSLMALLVGCSVTHVQPNLQSPDLGNYQAIKIGEVKVYSLEPNAADNQELHEKIEGWQTYSTDMLVNTVERNGMSLTEPGSAQSLLVDLDINVLYGNRALRWAVGMGAGKGGVYAKLTAKDALTGELKYDADANADLLGGAFGGDIGELLQLKVQKLIDHFVESRTKPVLADIGE